MPASTRVLVVDSDATSQGDIQRFLVCRRFVVLGGADLGEESAAMARAFQPEVVLLNLDDGRESYSLADVVASEFPETRVIAYSRRKDVQPASAAMCFGDRPVRVVPAKEKTLLAAIESALGGAPESEAVAIDSARDESGPPATVGPTDSGGWRGGRPTPLQPGTQPFLRRFAEVASEWLLTRSPQAEERLLAALAEDVQAPSFGGRGRDAVRRGLEGLAWRLGNDFRLIPSDLGGEPVLAVVVETRDGHWHRAGRFVVRAANGSAVSYFDYRAEERAGDDKRTPTS
jgi:DNA-binding NarL/FixJ family response regulator